MEEWARTISQQIWSKPRRVYPEQQEEEMYETDDARGSHPLQFFNYRIFYRCMIKTDHIL